MARCPDALPTVDTHHLLCTVLENHASNRSVHVHIYAVSLSAKGNAIKRTPTACPEQRRHTSVVRSLGRGTIWALRRTRRDDEDRSGSHSHAK
jgi:hypothetical protein